MGRKRLDNGARYRIYAAADAVIVLEIRHQREQGYL